VRIVRYYAALIHKEAASDYGVSFPDLPGCITAGRTIDEARTMAAAALALHLEGLEAEGEPIPEPSSLDDLEAVVAERGGVLTIIPAPTSTGTKVRVNVVLPVDLLAETDRCAEAVGSNRSDFIVQALKHELSRTA
jgi:predicted RNase H-like HicB family nuclease